MNLLVVALGLLSSASSQRFDPGDIVTASCIPEGVKDYFYAGNKTVDSGRRACKTWNNEHVLAIVASRCKESFKRVTHNHCRNIPKGCLSNAQSEYWRTPHCFVGRSVEPKPCFPRCKPVKPVNTANIDDTKKDKRRWSGNVNENMNDFFSSYDWGDLSFYEPKALKLSREQRVFGEKLQFLTNCLSGAATVIVVFLILQFAPNPFANSIATWRRERAEKKKKKAEQAKKAEAKKAEAKKAKPASKKKKKSIC
uniref:Sushi domain-containing protein n=1 Tax=Steinernema glaseri TaxID=37863 RepID=A0A1I8AST0_9BILA